MSSCNAPKGESMTEVVGAIMICLGVVILVIYLQGKFTEPVT